MGTVARTATISATVGAVAHTANNQAVGADGGSDVIYIIAGARSTSGVASAACTVDGVAATQAGFAVWSGEGGGIVSVCGIWAVERNDLPDPTQTDVNVVVTYSASVIRGFIDTFVSPDCDAAAHDFTIDVTASGTTYDVSVDTVADGIVLAGVYAGDPGSSTWTGITEDTDTTTPGGTNNYSTAHANSTTVQTPRTVSVVNTATLAAVISASFAEADTGSGVGASAGVATVSGVGVSINDTVASSIDAAAVVAGVSSAQKDAAGSSAGVAVAAGGGNSIVPGVGNSSGIATAGAITSTFADTVGTSTGTSTVSGVASIVDAAVGSSIGLSAATATGNALIDAIGNSAGTSGAFGVTNSVDGVAEANGASEAIGVSSALGGHNWIPESVGSDGWVKELAL